MNFLILIDSTTLSQKLVQQNINNLYYNIHYYWSRGEDEAVYKIFAQDTPGIRVRIWLCIIVLVLPFQLSGIRFGNDQQHPQRASLFFYAHGPDNKHQLPHLDGHGIS